MMDRVVYHSSKRITCAYGRYSNGKPHNGIDLGWVIEEEKNKVYANCKGKVVYIKDGLNKLPISANSYGNYITIEHPNGMFSRYAHLKKGTIEVKVGQEVDENTFLAIMGDSGSTKGRHLHFEVQTNNSLSSRINPTKYLANPIYNGKVENNVIEIAKEVIAGKWGNGQERVKRLEESGYSYDEVQSKVNELLGTKLKNCNEVAKEVIQGKWGNGIVRYNKLTKLGYDYDKIQSIVNNMLKSA